MYIVLVANMRCRTYCSSKVIDAFVLVSISALMRWYTDIYTCKLWIWCFLWWPIVHSGSKGTQRAHGNCQRVWNSALVPTLSSQRCKQKTQVQWRHEALPCDGRGWNRSTGEMSMQRLFLGTTFWSARRVLVNLYEFVRSSLVRVARGTRVSRWRTSSRHIGISQRPRDLRFHSGGCRLHQQLPDLDKTCLHEE